MNTARKYDGVVVAAGRRDDRRNSTFPTRPDRGTVLFRRAVEEQLRGSPTRCDS